MILSHKIQLNPTKDQVIQFAKASGCARFSYNWGLNKWSEMYKGWKGNNQLPKPNGMLVKKEFNKIKETEYPWIYESPKDSNQQPFANLQKSFNSFFKKKSKYPQFKHKGKKDSFYVSNDKFKIKEDVIQLPKIGKVKLTEKLRFPSDIILSCTISRQSTKWFASISVEVPDYKKQRKSNNQIGLDFGIKTLVTDQLGNQINSPLPLKNNLKRLKLYQQNLSRKVKGSKNQTKQKIKIAKLHYRISNIRKDFTNKLTSNICSENQTIIIEDLNVKSWSTKFGKSCVDGNVGEVIRQLKYKKDIFNNELVIIDKWFPSSKTCSGCGKIKQDLKLSDRIYKCNHCGLELDRDHNAAKNIYTLGLREIKACGHITASSEFNSELSLVDEARTIDKVESCGRISLSQFNT